MPTIRSTNRRARRRRENRIWSRRRYPTSPLSWAGRGLGPDEIAKEIIAAIGASFGISYEQLTKEYQR